MSPTAKPILHVVIPEELLAKLDDFRFSNRISTRAEAVRWLIAWALPRAPAPSKEKEEDPS
jgi:metal-responsive CopG/Arc/MetJ family transcriptional regulator